ncbi:hypothetical protein D046_1203A, partial [Vibrio parahaemolyticus V-223/04]
MRKHGNNAP